MRGEHIHMDTALQPILDSSPLARETHINFIYNCKLYRFIPSCEGNTLSVFAGFARVEPFVVQAV